MASSTILLFIFSMWLLLSSTEATEYVVGDSENSWKVPLPSSDSLSQWAQSHRFTIGDAIIFKYDNKTESVHIVNEEDYSRCKPKGKHVVFKDGNSKVVFTKSGPKHFISGKESHCKMGLKLAVLVMSKKHQEMSPPPALSPSPLPSPSPIPPSPLPSPSPIPPNNQGVACNSGSGFIMWLGVSLVMMFFLI